jgi:hypothetical protein
MLHINYQTSELTIGDIGALATSGYQIVNVGGAITGASPTGFTNDATVYSAIISVDGILYDVEVTGSAAQTYATLISEINTDLLGSGGSAAIVAGNIKISSTNSGFQSRVDIFDVDLFSSLTDFVAIFPSVPGIDEATFLTPDGVSGDGINFVVYAGSGRPIDGQGTSGARRGGVLSFYGGSSSGRSNGGDVNLFGGNLVNNTASGPGTNRVAGSVSLKGGSYQGSHFGSPGSVNIQGGDNVDTINPGGGGAGVFLLGGAGTDGGEGGLIALQSANGINTGNAGAIIIETGGVTGATPSGDSGSISLSVAPFILPYSTDSGTAGSINLTAGISNTGTSGSINITAGHAHTTATAGSVIAQGGNGGTVGNGGFMVLVGGDSGSATGDGGSAALNGGNAVSAAGAGGSVGISTGNKVGGADGTISLEIAASPVVTISFANVTSTIPIIAPGSSSDSAANITLGSNTVAPTSTDGFPYIPVITNTPTGVPTTKTGFAPMVLEDTGAIFKIWVYVGGTWKFATLT